MLTRTGSVRLVLGLIAMAMATTWSTVAHAQPGGNTDNSVNVSAGPAGGIEVRPGGEVDLLTMPENATEVMRAKAKGMRAQPGQNALKPSKLRMISLTRLEKVVAAKLAKGEKLDEEILYLAGLARIQYVFLYPETKDIVIAGPAEGIMSDPTGRMVGTETGRAIVQLEDLIVALRAFAPGQKGATVIGCSIDPTKEGLVALQQKLVEVGRKMTAKPNPAQANAIAGEIRESLGLQNVTVNGVSPKTHFAKVLVEADYKMKLIGIGIDRKPSKNMKSYVDVVQPAAVSRNALKRWYFVPNYECIRVTSDDSAAEFVGDGVKLVGEDELVSGDGSRQQTGSADKASKTFTESFTKAYPDIARRATVYGQLRNVIDLSVLAAYMQKKDFYSKAGWTMETFGDEKKFATETHNAPKQVQSACIALAKGNRVSFPIGGGVSIQAKQAFATDNILSDDEGKVAERRDSIDLKNLADGQWWWD